jgi:aminoglycoside/choline kinase family phosphotransferase
VDLLAELHAAPPPAGLRPYDRAELAREALIFLEWYAPAAGLALDAGPYLEAWDAAWGGVLAETRAAPVLTLRDFHADNLMLLDRPGHAGLGLLDFQDALAGHPAYDLVSLLRDVRREVPQRLERAMLQRYMDAANVANREGFTASYEIIGAQRHAKILGVFVRLRDRDGRSGYVERLPREWGHLGRAFRHPALAGVRDWFDANVPPELREPWCR